jgi:hypothetical protein
MRLNANTTITGDRVALVPYRREHVERYHGWMRSPELQVRGVCGFVKHDSTKSRLFVFAPSAAAPKLLSLQTPLHHLPKKQKELTASEPLSLEEEYEMCDRWAADADKLTFILLDLARPAAPEQASWPPGGRVGAMAGDGALLWVYRPLEVLQFLMPQKISNYTGNKNQQKTHTPPHTHKNINTTTTVNAFLNDPDDPSTAELEVMVAEPGSRGRGIAAEALGLLMAYMVKELDTARFIAKIGTSNMPSLALFAQLGFVEFRRVEVFDEVHLELRVEGSVKERLVAAGKALRLGRYEKSGADSG